MPQIKLASWNVNSLKVRLPQLLDWLKTTSVDAVVLQETKLTDELFPAAQIEAAGYAVVFTGQKTYNGVALLAKKSVFETPEAVDLNMPGYPDIQKRLVAATLTLKEDVPGDVRAIRFVGGYFPNGMETGSWKYLYKLDWIRALTEYLKTSLQTEPALVLGGDFNIAPADLDVWNPAERKDEILVSPPERTAFAELLGIGLTDSFRLKHPEQCAYSWWDYRMKGFELDHGLRIDHLLVSDALKTKVVDATIDTAPRSNTQPSDHAPVLVTFDF